MDQVYRFGFAYELKDPNDMFFSKKKGKVW
jgi:hypothetical protein